MTPSITQDDVNTAIAAFLSLILPPGVAVIVGQINRVAQPLGDLVVLWPLRLPRLSTNLDSMADAKFQGSIASTVMTVTSVEIGVVAPGRTVFGVGVADNTTVLDQIDGVPGGAGHYTIAPTQSVADTTLSAGSITVEQSTECVYQLDVHGPNSFSNAQVISTLFRDGYAVDQMADTGVTPLYADDPRQLPFITAASQYEDRWVIEAHLQIRPTVSVPQQFADIATIEAVDVDVAYPA